MPSPGMPFNQMMTFPCELTLRTTPEGPRLSWQPVRELARLRGSQRGWSRLAVPAGEHALSGVTGGTLDIKSEFEQGQAKRAGLIISGVPVVVDFEAREIRCGDQRAPLARHSGRARLQILVDRTSLEIFANDGLAYLPMRFQPKGDAAPLATLAEGGTAVAHSILVIELKSIWPTE
jgi:sucrose-6-phosphate hydrolase SacC (GH32 family)